MKSISRDATVYRGYPCAAVSAGLTYYGIGKWFPKFSQPGKAALALVAGENIYLLNSGCSCNTTNLLIKIQLSLSDFVCKSGRMLDFADRYHLHQ